MSAEPTRAAVGRRPRAKRPERIDLGNGETAVRNDIVAAESGISERTLTAGRALFIDRGYQISTVARLQTISRQPHSAQEPAAPPGRKRPRSVRLLIKENPRRRFWPPARDVHNLGLDVQEYDHVGSK